MEQERYKRLRKIFKAVNLQRRQTRKKMDILCNDMVSAQRDICRKMEQIAATADFFEMILGINELSEICRCAAEYLGAEKKNIKIAIFLRGKSGESSCAETSFYSTEIADLPALEDLITEEVVEGICKEMRLCGLDDMIKHGLSVSPMLLKGLQVIAMPIGEPVAAGFVLIYGRRVEEADIRRLNHIRNGLAKAVNFCHAQVR